MKIKLGLIVCLLVSGVLHAQKPVTVECSVGEGVGTTIQLFGVDKGEKKVLASITKMVIMVLVLSRNTKVFMSWGMVGFMNTRFI